MLKVPNNRPITAVSDDPEDCSALTPNHFLLQKATQLPPGVFVKEDSLSRKRCRKVQFLANHYWKRWIREYLPTLQKRSKRVKSRRNVQIGDLVLVAEDNVLRNRWLMGRGMEVFWRRRSAVCQNQNSKQRVPPSSDEVMPAGGSFLNGHVCWVLKTLNLSWTNKLRNYSPFVGAAMSCLFPANFNYVNVFSLFFEHVNNCRSQNLEPKRRCFRVDSIFFFVAW